MKILQKLPNAILDMWNFLDQIQIGLEHIPLTLHCLRVAIALIVKNEKQQNASISFDFLW